ncbi:MAG TPA: acyltransferase family protein [Pseudomonadales bacterium]|nr:acyltransferase family protein [Pseudomonadales bacterium]
MRAGGQASTAITYRRDIDGLRAVAVLPVLGFHAGIAGFPGGFVGVDVFFVISGFLITRVIAAEQARGAFTLRGFYERRARRILPALFAVLLVTFVASLWLLSPDRLVSLGHDTLAVLGFVSNMRFWWGVGYFASAASYEPLIHTWSLAVEEQFYLLYPLLLMLLPVVRRRVWLLWIVAALALASLAVGEWVAQRDPSAVFYLAPLRAWELGLGALVALRPRGTGESPFMAEVAVALGLVMIAGSVVLYTDATPFPGLFALPPTLGAALVLDQGAGARRAAEVLRSRCLVGVGLISYSLYLCHQPVLALYRFHSGAGPGAWETAVLLAVSVLLAVLSWRFIEQPCRSRARVPARAFWIATLATAALLAGSAVAVVLGAGYPSRFDGHAVFLVDRDALRRETWVEVTRQAAAPSPSARTAIVGDSLGVDAYNALVLGECATPDSIRPLITLIECAPLGRGKDYVACANDFRFVDSHLDEIDRIVLAPAWHERFRETLAPALDRWQAAGVDVAVMLRGPMFEDPLRRLRADLSRRMSMQEALDDVRATELADEVALANGWVRELAEARGLPTIDRMEAACPQGVCELMDERQALFYYDRHHWTLAGAKRFGRRLCDDRRLARFLEPDKGAG